MDLNKIENMKTIIITLNWNTGQMEKCIRDLKKLVSANKNLNRQKKKKILTWIKDYDTKYNALHKVLPKYNALHKVLPKNESPEIVSDMYLYIYTMYYLLIKAVATCCDSYKLTEPEKDWFSNLWKFRNLLLEEITEEKTQIYEIYDLWRKIILILESEEINTLIKESRTEKVMFLSIRFAPMVPRTRITKKKLEVSKIQDKRKSNKS